MKYTIQTTSLKDQDISLRQLGLLIYLASDNDVQQLQEDLKDLWHKGWVIAEGNKYVFDPYKWEDIKVLIDKEDDSEKHNRCLILAKRMKEIFPKGNREIGGKKYPFQEAERIIAQRLKKFFGRYGEDYSDEKIIEVTKSYVEQFNEDYTYMKSLKYFIFKDETKHDGFGQGYVDENSLLLSFLENPEEARKSVHEFIHLR